MEEKFIKIDVSNYEHVLNSLKYKIELLENDLKMYIIKNENSGTNAFWWMVNYLKLRIEDYKKFITTLENLKEGKI